ncbi:MAG: S8 family serine peptidase [Pseudomonadota bacterium]
MRDAISSRGAGGAALALTLGLLAGCAVFEPSAQAPAPAPAGALFDETEILALTPDAAGAAALQEAARAGGYRLRRTRALTGLDLILLSFDLPAGVTGPEAIEALEAAVNVATVGVNHAYALQQSGGGAALDYADALLGWPAGGCAAAMPIGLIDTAVDPAAPPLAEVSVVSRSFVDGAEAPARHGTEVASVLADPRRLRGATLYSAAVAAPAGTGGRAGVDTLMLALDWLAAEGVRLVNVSLAGPYNKLLDQAMSRAQDRGLVVVAAVGNDGRAAEPLYPAAFDRAIAVTAVDADGRIYRNAVRGAHVDVAAPGVDVRVAAQGDAHAARFVTGTSFAAPFVTARLAADPAFAAAGGGVAAARAVIAATARDLGPAGADDTFGAGLLSAAGVCDPTLN